MYDDYEEPSDNFDFDREDRFWSTVRTRTVHFPREGDPGTNATGASLWALARCRDLSEKKSVNEDNAIDCAIITMPTEPGTITGLACSWSMVWGVMRTLCSEPSCYMFDK